MNYAGIIFSDIADSDDGECTSLWFNGCDVRCKGCHNKSLWDEVCYKDNEEEMNNLYRTHPDGSKWIHTGDLGYIDEDGFLFIEGRMKRMIMTVIDGKVYKIFPSKVEGEISQHKGVYEVCVVKATDGSNQVLKAFVVPEEGYKDKPAQLEKELRDKCAAALPENMWPVFYEMCADFPRTAAGKVDFKALEV